MHKIPLVCNANENMQQILTKVDIHETHEVLEIITHTAEDYSIVSDQE